jgi:hypothetical protein
MCPQETSVAALQQLSAAAADRDSSVKALQQQLDDETAMLRQQLADGIAERDSRIQALESELSQVVNTKYEGWERMHEEVASKDRLMLSLQRQVCVCACYTPMTGLATAGFAATGMAVPVQPSLHGRSCRG